MSRTELLQRAIHSAKCRIYRINYDLNCDISLNHQRKAENQKELMEITVDALEKQIPKKPHKEEFELCETCPVCGWLLECLPNYCEKCGQALDWSGRE